MVGTSSNDEKILKILKSIENNLKNINKNLTLLVLSSDQNIKLNISKLFDNENKKYAYELTDGYNSARNISNEVGVSISTINRWWKEWINSGILIRNNGEYRYPIKIMSLDELGLELIKPIRYDAYSDVYTKNQFFKILKENINNYEDVIVNFNNIFRKKLLNYDNRNDLIENIIDGFYKGSKREQLMFIQYLRQINIDTNNEIINYFKLWENNIKSEIR